MRLRNGWRDLLPIGIAGTFALYGIYLLLIGPEQETVTPGVSTSVISHNPSIVGLVPLIAGALVVFGMWNSRERFVWGGAMLAVLFSFAFLFSFGGIFIPIAVLLLASLVFRNLSMRDQIKRR